MALALLFASGCGGSAPTGGSGGDSQPRPTVRFTDGLRASTQDVTITRDDDAALEAMGPNLSVELRLATTQATARADLEADGGVRPDPACRWDVPAGAEGLTHDLVDELAPGADRRRDVTVLVDKRAALTGERSPGHWIRLLPRLGEIERPVFLGRNEPPDRNFLAFSYTDGDADPSNDAETIDDPRARRSFASAFGTVRVLQRFDADGDGVPESDEPLVTMICALEDVFTVTVAPEP